MGDRVCVDLCSLLRPGEGMLVGSFARALFLVHSEVGADAEPEHRSSCVHGAALGASQPGLFLGLFWE